MKYKYQPLVLLITLTRINTMQLKQIMLAGSLSLLSMLSCAAESPFWLNFSNDFSYVTSGGIEPHQSSNRYLLDTGYMYRGNTVDFTMAAQVHRGANGSDRVGDIQAYSNIDEDRFSKLYEAFASVHLPHQVDLILGKIDANGIFAYSDNAAEFINASMGFSPTITALPTYPDPALSINLVKNHENGHHIGAGIYAGSSARSFSDKFYIAEAGYAIENGRVKLGYWHHDGLWQTHQSSAQKAGTGGLYLIADYNWPQQNIAGFLQYGQADQQLADIKQHLGLGLVFEQTVGIGITKVWLGQQSLTNQDETTVELFYQWQASHWLTIKPDLQYIRHPGGSKQTANAMVATLRIMITI